MSFYQNNTVEKYSFQQVTATDQAEIELIAGWYAAQWGIPVSVTSNKISLLSEAKNEFQLLMQLDGRPVATGGIHTHVGLLDQLPAYRKYPHWLALVYTLPELRGKGYGAILCAQIQDYAAALGLREIFLFTDTAESLYTRLGWQPLERLVVGSRHIVIMNRSLI